MGSISPRRLDAINQHSGLGELPASDQGLKVQTQRAIISANRAASSRRDVSRCNRSDPHHRTPDPGVLDLDARMRDRARV